MSTTTRTLNASSAQVWRVLADGWLYPLWVVGASRMREVDRAWPTEGSKLQHSVGVWPVLIDDNTEVTRSEPAEALALRGRGWPLGEADIVITLRPVASGTEVEIDEDVVSGLGVLMPGPLRHRLITWRNVETLRRLALVVEGREVSEASTQQERDV